MSGLLEALATAVREGSEENALSLCERGLEAGIPPAEMIQEGLSGGMHEAGRLFGDGKLFPPELLIASAAMLAGVSVLAPAISAAGGGAPPKETVVIGVVEGDVHEIGKNLVRVMLESDGYRVIDLGYDVTAGTLVEQVEKTGARVLALSTMMTTTLPNMGRTVELALSMQPAPLVVVGGAPVSDELARAMGADGCAPNASEAAGLLDSILRERP